MSRFNIAPFALPNCEQGEVRFEESREVAEVIVEFTSKAPAKIGLSYLQKYWPERLFDPAAQMDNPCWYGWAPIDDWFNSRWHEAAVHLEQETDRRVLLRFKPLREEYPENKLADITWRWTLGVRIDVDDPSVIAGIKVYTTAVQRRVELLVEFNRGQQTTLPRPVRVTGYNAVVDSQQSGDALTVSVSGMKPRHDFANDDSLVTFDTGADRFTVSLGSLDRQGPVWFADRGVYIRNADDPTTFDEYRARIATAQTLSEQVMGRREQSIAGATAGQPRPHPVNYNLACKLARQRFWLEPNGDLVLMKDNVTRVALSDTPRWRAVGATRFHFGMERLLSVSRFCDPSPVPIYNIACRAPGDVLVEQRSLCVPVTGNILTDELTGDSSTAALVRFRFTNQGSTPAVAELPLAFSPDSRRTFNRLHQAQQDDYLIPDAPRDRITLQGNQVLTPHEGGLVLRCMFDTSMIATAAGDTVCFSKPLAPGESCELLVRIPYLPPNTEELHDLEQLDWERCERKVTAFWRNEGRRGAQLVAPEPHLEALHRSHLMHVDVTDFEMPDSGGLINTSVGTSTYGNFSNESTMIVHELDQRGLHDDARRRLELWVKYQGTAKQPGNFSDYDGMYFGAGGFEDGAYNQHHGWVLWCLCEHYFLTRDQAWMRGVADSVIAGADWVFRQRKLTMKKQPYSRGWERGFLPAGSLEDVTDFHYWLSTNSLTWRGTEWAARALESIEHPDAARVRSEANAFRADLIAGFERMREQSPLMRLRNGRWVPHYPSRIYCRGRDVGWIRELLEGAVYLLISGLYEPDSEAARWILDDYQDNRYPLPPYGYHIEDFGSRWFDRAGFSIQPNLLAGLMPYLDRDEPEIYIWMFCNAWASCYREEINAMIEHPAPVLGFSNSAHFKTSDEANAIMWLRYMLVYRVGDLLHFGRAVPREWFRSRRPFGLEGAATYFGSASVQFEPRPEQDIIRATVNIPADRSPGKVLLRFRHPDAKPIALVKINATAHSAFDPVKGDVDLTGYSGEVVVDAEY